VAVFDKQPAQPVRSVHNDAKVGNLRFAPGAAPTVLDLDTTMPGLVVSDVGELLRTATHDGLEDAADPNNVTVERERVDAVLEGFGSGMGGLLTSAERAAMRPAAPMMAIENAVRMLTDHLDGDHYFSVSYPGQNLVRSRSQVAVATCLMALT
jgi:Ser/Thr protein kinase RdoA (MazF antagonist)